MLRIALVFFGAALNQVRNALELGFVFVEKAHMQREPASTIKSRNQTREERYNTHKHLSLDRMILSDHYFWWASETTEIEPGNLTCYM